MLASLAGVAALAAAAWVLLPSRSAADPNKGEARPAAAAATPGSVELPIAQVVLFSSGVGYFQREGTVEGSARVDLSFPVSDINDLLKSMVLRDLDGGHVSAVSYDSNAPVERTLKSFALNLTGNPSFSALLHQARGEKAEVVLTQTNATQPGTLSGTIVGVEKQKQLLGKDAVEVELLNLWCADGLRSLKLSEVQRVRFLNPLLEGEFKKALETLALSHDTQKKAVGLHFAGEGKRRVKVGYVVENPIWKTSYRLVLGQDKEDRPYLQGWAVVENPTDEDWKDVRMALVSGRPISFQMDLYTPLYVPRPTVQLELFESLRPVAYSGRMGTEFEKSAAADAQAKKPAQGLADRGKDKAGFGRPADGKESLQKEGRYRQNFDEALREKLDLGGSVTPAAQATKLGDYFQYLIERPVSLARQKSALLPIVGKDVQAQRVSIYNERVQARFPLLGLKFKNSSGLHLMQGPITVFEGSNYAGDARILDIQPDEERLLSYAVDLGTEVDAKPSSDNGRLTAVKAVKGVLWTTTKVRETKTYTLKNRNDQRRLVLIEHPVRTDFKLVDTEKPAETASDFYRFQVEVAPGKTATQAVTEERVIGQTVALTSSTDQQLRVFLQSPVVSAQVKEGLNQAMKLRWDLNKTQREIAELQRQLKVITEDQGRLRANLREMPPTAAAYKRYLEKFDQQETQIEQYQKDIKKLQQTEHNQQKEFDDFLAHFSAE
jgi:hypothetical protein